MSQAAFTHARPRPDDQSSRPRKDRTPLIGLELPLAPGRVSPRQPQDSLPAPSAGAATSAELELLDQSLGEATEPVWLAMHFRAERFRLFEKLSKPHDD
jgi:hypothetical protein